MWQAGGKCVARRRQVALRALSGTETEPALGEGGGQLRAPLGGGDSVSRFLELEEREREVGEVGVRQRLVLCSLVVRLGGSLELATPKRSATPLARGRRLRLRRRLIVLGRERGRGRGGGIRLAASRRRNGGRSSRRIPALRILRTLLLHQPAEPRARGRDLGACSPKSLEGAAVLQRASVALERLTSDCPPVKRLDVARLEREHGVAVGGSLAEAAQLQLARSAVVEASRAQLVV
mmetsp:Transcript_41592/g.138323  ORF Transcript_41592/g.138323 Transcript_41592/m.138323 type:complete len:236 (+) Transcript_41592:819-1526(+)